MRSFRLVDLERAHHAVSLLCSVLEVTSQGYYAWKRREPSARSRRDDELKAEILDVFLESRDTYGAPRIADQLRRKRGIPIATKRVRRLMRDLDIWGVTRGRRRVRTTTPDSSRPVAPDLVRRDFTAAQPDRVWVADITYIETLEGYLFLAEVMDVYSRKIVGWAMRETLEAEIVSDALAMAVSRRRPQPGVIHHSDRGSQYTSSLMGRTLRDAEIIPSMGSKGDPYDNAMCESAIGTIKTELVRRHVFRTRDQARLAVFDYIECFYNPIRAHTGLGNLSPDEYEAEYHQNHSAAQEAA